jgi:hypothetical protein
MLHQLRTRAGERERSVAHVEFRSRGAAVDVGWSDLLWGGARVIALASHLVDCVIRNSGIRRDRLISRCQQKYQQIERWS